MWRMIESHLKSFFQVKVGFREAQMEMDINTELTGLRNEASFLRKENFDLKEKIQVWVQANRQTGDGNRLLPTVHCRTMSTRY